MENVLVVSGVSKRFSGLKALQDVSMTVKKKEVVGLIGPNGAGKTTLFNLISGALHPDSGSIELNGKQITKLPPHRISQLGLARTFQIPQPFPELTIEDNVRMAAIFSHSSKRARPELAQIDAILNLVGLGNKKDVLAKMLTASEKRRLELGRALAISPKLLLLDEMAAGLSAAEREEFSLLVKRLRTEFELTIVWTEHIVRLLMQTVDRVVVLDHGVKIAEDLPNEVTQNKRVLEAYLGGRLANE